MTNANLRTEYERFSLTEDEAGMDPLALFARWFREAIDSGGREPNAMALATADAQGRPAVRIVLCKDFAEQGFTFFTNFESRKGRELRANRQASALFFWAALERQVRIDGVVEELPAAASDKYFAQRPLDARIGAWLSQQSSPIPDRTCLEAQFAQLRERFTEQSPPPRPPHWGGYRLVPDAIEFWQGRPSRLHDRLLYARAGSDWTRTRLAP